MNMDSNNVLQYRPFKSCINPSFWHKFTQIKLDIDKLSDCGKNITATYTNCNSLGNFLDVDCISFNESYSTQPYIFPARGIIFNKNTIEEFKNCNKADLLNSAGEILWQKIINGDCLKDPALLTPLIILSFADLKSYKYYYWFAFPAPSIPIAHLENTLKICDVFSNDQTQSIYDAYHALPYQQQTNFIIFEEKSKLYTEILDKAIKVGCSENMKECLAKYDHIYFCFSDANNDANPGWSLRNYIALIFFHCPVLHGKTIKVLSLRIDANKTINNSLIFHIKLPINVDKCGGDKNETQGWVGWERNENGKFGPRVANIANSMDPLKLAESSVDLNLKLMKWRLLPELNLDKIKNLKCLLLGAGTLGCAVARCLLGWGIRNITFVDSGKVSYSNPVRQSLFTNADCLNGGKLKAETASAKLQEIFPGVTSQGYAIRIPMPGHTVGASLLDEMKDHLSTLKSLIAEHDCVFLLTDSRESRWLPTLLAAASNKIVITAALGFDSYLVMRHGTKSNDGSENTSVSTASKDGIKSISGDNLGCYFCNDVTAPGNSLQDRTLDQQCTVTRPGVSNIAASLAVELLVSISQHPLGPLAEAYYSVEINKNGMQKVIPSESLLGIIPHSIRGFLASYEHITPAVERFAQCIACSKSVMDAYSAQGDEFLFKVFESADYLETITGLAEMLQKLDHTEMWALSDTEDESDIND